MTVEQLLD